MPLKPINYSKNLNYKIVCKDPTITSTYNGSTTDITRRKSQHKNTCNNPNIYGHNCYVYQFIRANGGWDNWEVIELENYPCANLLEQTLRERYWLETLQCDLNTNVPSRNRQEWYNDNFEKIQKWKREYAEAHKEENHIEKNSSIGQYRCKNGRKYMRKSRRYMVYLDQVTYVVVY